MKPELYMQRCLQLAALGAGQVAPNPMVGAVLVHAGKIIGEGWHQRYGQAHAEVNCINQAIEAGHTALLGESVIYVSLEPCAHFGKTPPCANLIIRHGIRKVIIGCRDPFEQVNGKGIEKLQAAGVAVMTGVLEKECKELNKRFFTFHLQARPYIILKWAQTADGFIAGLPTTAMPADATRERLLVSNEYSDRLVHKWRSEEAAILIGTNTAVQDNPSLTNRYWTGSSPVRLVIDRNLRLPASLQVFDQKTPTIVFNTIRQEERKNLVYQQVKDQPSLLQPIMNELFQCNIQSVLVEGGAELIHSFMKEGLWDEARVIYSTQQLGEGLRAPRLENAIKTGEIKLLEDRIELFKRTN